MEYMHILHVCRVYIEGIKTEVSPVMCHSLPTGKEVLHEP